MQAKHAGRNSHAPRAGWLSMGGVYNFIFCLTLSRMLAGMPVLGGAMYMCGQVAAVYLSGEWGNYNLMMSRRSRVISTVGLAVLLLISLAAAALYPMNAMGPMVWLLFAVILAMTMGDVAGWRLIYLSLSRGMEEKRFALLYTLIRTVQVFVGAGLLLGNVPGVDGWMAVGGYALAVVVSVYGQLKQRQDVSGGTPANMKDVAHLHDVVRRANAYKTYETLSGLILVAQQLTVVLMYTFLAITAEQMLICMAVALLCMLLCREVTEWLMARRASKRSPEPVNLMLVGLFLWLYGLILFSRMLRENALGLANAYFCLGLCTGGSTICMTCLGQMERVMVAVARFTAGEESSSAVYDQMRLTGGGVAALTGQMLALGALTLLFLLDKGNGSTAELAPRLQPVMVIPALLTVLGAVLAALKFPLSQRYMDKLQRFLHLREEGGENPALEKQLETVVIKRHRLPFGTHLVMALLRPFFRHKLQDTENIVQDENNPIVFLCNHGEMYGPIVCMLYIPVPIRPWVISEISLDPEEVAQYVYRFTISRQKWLPEKLKMPIARLIGPISVWAMNQVECIPVYRNKPSKLMTTFRLSVEAMQAGDNLLIFPENPNAKAEDHGYEREGLGELFSGFTMLAQLYYKRTGKCCRFLPMYAHKNMRTMTFAKPITYDPDNDPMAERDRIVDYATREMQRIADEEEARWEARKDARREKK